MDQLGFNNFTATIIENNCRLNVKEGFTSCHTGYTHIFFVTFS